MLEAGTVLIQLIHLSIMLKQTNFTATCVLPSKMQELSPLPGLKLADTEVLAVQVWQLPIMMLTTLQ
jgi:hypothetical protein